MKRLSRHVAFRISVEVGRQLDAKIADAKMSETDFARDALLKALA